MIVSSLPTLVPSKPSLPKNYYQIPGECEMGNKGDGNILGGV